MALRMSTRSYIQNWRPPTSFPVGDLQTHNRRAIGVPIYYKEPTWSTQTLYGCLGCIDFLDAAPFPAAWLAMGLGSCGFGAVYSAMPGRPLLGFILVHAVWRAAIGKLTPCGLAALASATAGAPVEGGCRWHCALARAFGTNWRRPIYWATSGGQRASYQLLYCSWDGPWGHGE